MKKFTTSLKALVFVGLVLSLGVVAYNASAAVEPYPQSSGFLISRVGSLVLAPTALSATLTASYVNSFSRCEKTGNTGTATHSCLDVQGTGSFANLIANNMRTFFMDKTFVGPSDGAGPALQTVPLLIADTAADNDSIMVSDLGRFNVGGEFEPVDTTTMRGVCADANGEFYACPVPDAPLTVCPLTYTDQDNNVVYPIVDVDGVCWFGRDLERNQINDANAERIYDFMDDDTFVLYSTSVADTRNDELTDDIVFVKEGGVIKVVYSSSDYLPISGAIHSEGDYRSINTAFKSFLLTTCDWDVSSMGAHTWGSDENYYIIDFQIAQHNEASAEPYLKPTYNITCREYTTDSSYNFGYVTLESKDFDKNKFHVAVYSIEEPQMADVVNQNKGVFVQIEDIYDYTCPTGWHVPRTAEWSDLETAMEARSVAEGTTLSNSTLATEMNFNPDNLGSISPGSNSSGYEYRYNVREMTNDYSYSGLSSSYGEVRRDGYKILTNTGNVTFDPFYEWQKRFAAWRVWHFNGPYISHTQPTNLFAYVVDMFKTKKAEALPGGDGDGLIGKVRCVQGTELTIATGAWDTCHDDGSGSSTQTYSILSCSIGGESGLNIANCGADSEGGPVHGETRSCIIELGGEKGGVVAG